MVSNFYSSLFEIIGDICSGEIYLGNTTIIYINREVYEITTITTIKKSIVSISILLFFVLFAVVAYCLCKKRKEKKKEKEEKEREEESVSPLSLMDEIDMPTTSYNDTLLFTTTVREPSSNEEDDNLYHGFDFYDGNTETIQKEEIPPATDFFGITVTDPEPNPEPYDDITVHDFALLPNKPEENTVQEPEKPKEEEHKEEEVPKVEKKRKRRRVKGDDQYKSSYRSISYQSGTIIERFKKNAEIQKGLAEGKDVDKSQVRDIYIIINKKENDLFNEFMTLINERQWPVEDKVDTVEIKIEESVTKEDLTKILTKAFKFDKNMIISIKKRKFPVEEEEEEYE